MLSPGIIIPFDGNHADIPDGFSRYTALDDKYPKGTADGVNPGTTGGAETHTHSSPSHSHSVSAHTHTGTTTTDKHEDGGTDANDNDLWNGSHYHSFSVSSITSQSVGSVSVTYSAYSNHPPYYEVIFIQADQYVFIPNNGMILSEATSRVNMSFHSASADRYLKGAGTGANAGATGGSTTNAHTISHTHSTQHSQGGYSGGPNTGNIAGQAGPSEPSSSSGHRHYISLSSVALTSNSNSSIGSQSETVEPAHRTLNAYKNSSGNSILPQPGDIAMYVGSLDSIPSGWLLCDGNNSTPDMRSKFMKINASASASTTGGSNSHNHASQSHTHTLPSHTHSGSAATSPDDGQNTRYDGDAHNIWTNERSNPHSLSTVNNATGSLASASTSANTSDNQPPYLTVAYVQMQFRPFGGSSFFFSKMMGFFLALTQAPALIGGLWKTEYHSLFPKLSHN